MKIIFQICISTLIIFLLLKDIELSAIWHALRSTNVKLMVPALVVNVIGSVILNAVQIFTHIKMSKIATPRRHALFYNLVRIDFIVRFYAQFLPAGLAAAIRVERYGRLGIDYISSTLIVIINKILQLLVISLTVFLVVSTSQDLNLEERDKLLIIISALILSFILSIGIAFTLGHRGRKYLHMAATSILQFFSRIKLKFAHALLDKLNRTISSNTELHYPEAIFLIAITASSYILVAASQFMVLISVGIDINFADALLIRGVTLFMIMLPFSFGGLGLREAGMVGVLSLYAVPPETSLAAAAILLFFQLIVSAMGGIFEARSVASR